MAAQLLRSSFIAGVIFLFGIVIPPAFATINFAITNPNTSNDETEVEVNVTGLTSSSCLDNRCYLQGSLTAVDKNQYFGFTQNTENNWYEYQSSPSSSDVIKSTFFHFEPKEGSWSGKLKIKNNPNHANYQGPGQYLLAVRRYSGKAVSSAGESNSLTVTLSAIPCLDSAQRRRVNFCHRHSKLPRLAGAKRRLGHRQSRRDYHHQEK